MLLDLVSDWLYLPNKRILLQMHVCLWRTSSFICSKAYLSLSCYTLVTSQGKTVVFICDVYYWTNAYCNIAMSIKYTFNSLA